MFTGLKWNLTCFEGKRDLMFNFDISSFFNNSNQKNNSIFGSFDFTQYASIRNGSYGKLTKAYYAKDAEEKKSNKTNSDKTNSTTKKNVDIDSTGLSKMRTESDGLKSSAEKLSKSELYRQADMDKIAAAVKDFASEYNDVIAQSSKVNSKDVSSNVKLMTSMTDTMSKALSKVGISVGQDGKLSVNEDTLKNSDANTVKSLFSGTYSYGAQVADKASEISKAALMSASTYSSNGSLTSAIPGSFNNWI